jgi:hypothetical protein
MHMQQRKLSHILWLHATIEEDVGLRCTRCYTTVLWTLLCSSESTHNNRGSGIFFGSSPRLYNEDLTQLELDLTMKSVDLCGVRVEYLHCDPASYRRWWKGKSQIWDSKIWSWVPVDLDLRKTVLARASSIYKRHIRPLVREDAPQKQDRNCQTVINISPRLTDWPTASRNVTFTFTFTRIRIESSLWSWQVGRIMARKELGSVKKTSCMRLV